MSDNELQTVFKPFVTGAKEKTNMGIGLSVTSEIIKAHNGKLKVQSKLNEGSIFTIILPLIK